MHHARPSDACRTGEIESYQPPRYAGAHAFMAISPQLRSIAVLLASDCDVTAHALTSVLGADGYAVERVRSGRETISAVRAGWPSAVIVDADMPDATAMDVCRELRGDGNGTGAVPVILVNADGDRRSDRLAAYGAGAWEVYARPFDGTHLLLKLQTFVHARHVMNDRLGAGCLLDAETGLYNLAGLIVRARELQALLARRRGAMTFIAFLPGPASGTVGSGATSISAADVLWTLRDQLRVSDVFGQVGDELAIIAPETDSGGALHLLNRLQTSLDDLARDRGEPATTMQVTYSVIADCGEPGVSAVGSLTQTMGDLRDSLSMLKPGIITPTPPDPARDAVPGLARALPLLEPSSGHLI